MKRLTHGWIADNVLSVLKGGDLLFIVSPFTTTSLPALGPHILQALATKKGLTLEILYLNMLVTPIIGTQMSERISFSETWMFWRMLGERLFARSAYGLPKLGRFAEYCNNESMSISGNEHHTKWCYENEDFDIDQYRDIEEICTSFVDTVAPIIGALNYKIIGYPVRIGQTNCSIALLNRISTIRPDIISVIGGANCEAEMAEGILSLTENIDYVFSGESEVAFSYFLDQYLRGELPANRVTHGEPLEDLDNLPPPEYTNFVEQRQKFMGLNTWTILYETSRGCWWGEKHKCTFCGQHKERIKFRQKNARKVLNELSTMNECYSNNPVLMTDNIMPRSFYKDLLPMLKNKSVTPPIAYMQKANLKLQDLLALKHANVIKITPGIESLSSELLTLMDKGVTAKGNLLLLRNAYSVGMHVDWLCLWGIPGDKIVYYTDILKLLPLIHHLQPPTVFTHLFLERFSVYFEKHQEYEIKNIRPWAVYDMIYPQWADILKLSHFFVAEYPCEAHQHPEIIQQLADDIRVWRRVWEHTHLTMTSLKNHYLIYDNRSLHSQSNTHIVNFDEAKEIMTSCVYKETDLLKWAVDEKLGVVVDSWYVPLITASPELLLQFEGTP